MNKQICKTNKTCQEKLDVANKQFIDAKKAEFDADLQYINQFNKHIEDVCYCLAGCAKPTEATEGLFPVVSGGRIKLPSLFDALSQVHALECGLKYEDNPYSNRYGKFSDGSVGLGFYDRYEKREVMDHWLNTVLLPQLKGHLGRSYTKEHDGEMFGDWWLKPDDETVVEYMTYWKPAPYSLFFFPLLGQVYFITFILRIIYAISTRKWYKGE